MQISALGEDQGFGESMLEEIRRTAERRLQQIEPLLEEAERLRDVLAVLDRRSAGAAGQNAAGDEPSDRRATARRPRPTTTPRSRGGALDRSGPGMRAAKGSNKRAILELVGSAPGITVAEITRLTGMKRTVVASTVSRLKRHGELRDREGGGVCVPAAASLPDPPVAPMPAKHAGIARQRSRRLAPVQRRAA